MRLPVVAIIGRPNVGKSTLVNRIVGSRKAIVDDLPGVTRDRAYYDAHWLNHNFTLVDTGGLAPGEDDLFATKVNEQVMIALEEADVIIWVVDGLTGITPYDEAIAKPLRKMKTPVIIAVNKMDNRTVMGNVAEFYSLGMGDPMPVSAMHGTVGVGDMLDKTIQLIEGLNDPEISLDKHETESIHIAFVGRPNVGKSSLVNKLLGTERNIVSDVPGTTRDAIDTEITWREESFTLVDTAGIRKKSKVAYGIELFSVDRAIRSIKRTDVTVLVLDATEGVTDQDKRIVETSNEYGKALVIVINKWDLQPDKNTKSTKEYEQDVVRDLPHARFAPIVFVSALTGQRLDRIFEKAVLVNENNHRRISTSVVNQLMMEACTMTAPPPVKGKRLKIYYATQVDVAPPRFLLFVNSDKLLNDTYRRYLEHRLRDNIALEGSPIVLACRNKKEKEQ